MPNLPMVYKILGILVALGFIYIGGYWTGWSGEHSKLVAFTQATKDAGDAQAKAVALKDAQNEQLKKDTLNEYQTNLAAVNARWAYRLRNYSGSCELPKDTTTATGTSKNPSDSLPPIPQLIEDCAATTVQLEALQDWIRKSR